MEMGGHRKGMIMDNDGKGSYRETEKEKRIKGTLEDWMADRMYLFTGNV
jgi:hypothetical protein